LISAYWFCNGFLLWVRILDLVSDVSVHIARCMQRTLWCNENRFRVAPSTLTVDLSTQVSASLEMIVPAQIDDPFLQVWKSIDTGRCWWSELTSGSVVRVHQSFAC
jgi:hypothetical protein